MKRNLVFLTGLALLCQVRYAVAQARAANIEGLNQLFSLIIRSSAVKERQPETTAAAGDYKVLLKASCERLLKVESRILFLSDRNGKMKLQVRGIYTQGSALYFVFRLKNQSALDYDVADIRFYVVDPAGRKKPSVRLGELLPVFLYDSSFLIRGNSRATNVIVLPRFTLPHGKHLLIEVLEKNGGRHLQVQATNLTLERARVI